MTQNPNPYLAAITRCQKELANNQNLLKDPNFADPKMQELVQEEIKQLETELKSLEAAAADLLEEQHNQEKPEHPDQNVHSFNAIIEIRGGAGGDEAKIWASELMRMYQKFCLNHQLKIELIDDLVFKVKGKAKLPVFQLIKDKDAEKLLETAVTEELGAFTLLRYEAGVHRVQRVPVTEAQGRLHTSTASVAVLPEIHAQAIEIKDEDLKLQFMRASGAGGQSVNKTSSAVRLTHIPSGIVVVARSERKQVQNRQIAMELLRAKLWEIEEEKKQAALGSARENIGRSMRAEKIKTYNFPQNRLTDHRIKQSWHNLSEILEGNLEEAIAGFRAYLTK
jgi:peptide chain release factor 1